MREKMSLFQMEDDVQTKLGEYEKLVDSFYNVAMQRSQIKRAISEREKRRDDARARTIRLAAMGAVAVGSLIFYSVFFGW